MYSLGQRVIVLVLQLSARRGWLVRVCLRIHCVRLLVVAPWAEWSLFSCLVFCLVFLAHQSIWWCIWHHPSNRAGQVSMPLCGFVCFGLLLWCCFLVCLFGCSQTTSNGITALSISFILRLNNRLRKTRVQRCNFFRVGNRTSIVCFLPWKSCTFALHPLKFGNVQGKCFHICWSFCYYRSSTLPCLDGSFLAPEIGRRGGDLPGSRPVANSWLLWCVTLMFVARFQQHASMVSQKHAPVEEYLPGGCLALTKPMPSCIVVRFAGDLADAFCFVFCVLHMRPRNALGLCTGPQSPSFEVRLPWRTYMEFTNSVSGKYKLVERPGESHEGVGRKKRLMPSALALYSKVGDATDQEPEIQISASSVATKCWNRKNNRNAGKKWLDVSRRTCL